MEHNIVISEDQNTVIVDGRMFIAEEDNGTICSECEFRKLSIRICYQIPCTPSMLFEGPIIRKDNRKVIFKERLKTE